MADELDCVETGPSSDRVDSVAIAVVLTVVGMSLVVMPRESARSGEAQADVANRIAAIRIADFSVGPLIP